MLSKHPDNRGLTTKCYERKKAKKYIKMLFIKGIYKMGKGKHIIMLSKGNYKASFDMDLVKSVQREAHTSK